MKRELLKNHVNKIRESLNVYKGFGRNFRKFYELKRNEIYKVRRKKKRRLCALKLSTHYSIEVEIGKGTIFKSCIFSKI